MTRPSRHSEPVTGLPVAGFGCNPREPAAGVDVRFFDYSYDPGHLGIALRRWDFGDGSFSDERQPTHRYGADGAYAVRLTVRTPDGRLGAATAVIRVCTHRVAIASIRVPASCVPGETVDVVVEVSSARYDEIVDVRLFVRLSDPEPQAVAMDRATIAVRGGDAAIPATATLRATIPEAAATVGSVTLEAVTSILGAFGPTPVRRGVTASILVAAPGDR